MSACFLQDGAVVPTKPQGVSDSLLAKAQGTEGFCATPSRAVAPKGTLPDHRVKCCIDVEEQATSTEPSPLGTREELDGGMSCRVSPPTFATSRLAVVHETCIQWLSLAPEKLGKELPSPVTDQDGAT